IQRKLEREQQEQERLREVEREKKEREDQWRRHVAELASKKEETLKNRASRLRDFRNFQKKVLVDELGQDPACTREMVDQLLVRM
ncbi:U2 small nuclear ribonucleoprotein auxiliary factor 35 kDa subunit-related protein 1-like, partial [Engraulis encrasicolus]|uniref:U2 small nuclear ribonucleoprotein auxiliary factor 35 kDa subunit-related protein 1-like n=1 Tax=Engraulis encrasicolus TaxID=184585 RepID=UPI002FD26C0D